jgi:hypothetical protein
VNLVNLVNVAECVIADGGALLPEQVSEYPGPWVLRPCGPDRPILARTLPGPENTARKFRLGAYLKKYGTESFRRAVNN